MVVESLEYSVFAFDPYQVISIRIICGKIVEISCIISIIMSMRMKKGGSA